MNNSPENIFREYETARRFKSSLGRLGLYEQNRINERFYVGDQWSGAVCGSERPLVRHNIIKRIGDYKIAQIGASPIAVNYSAEGFSQTVSQIKRLKAQRKSLAGKSSAVYSPLGAENEIGLMISALNLYRKTAADRIKLDDIIGQALNDAYIRGTGAIYTYFDNSIKTGLFADRIGGTQIMGDIACERIKIENIYFGDPQCTELQKQPFIILAEEKEAQEVAKEIIKYGGATEVADRIAEQAGKKITLLTKLFKLDVEGEGEKVFAVKVASGAVVRPVFCTGVSLYPISIFSWQQRDDCIYGDSEITYIIPNQIAINRMVTASVWSAMSAGMPLMVVNGDIVSSEITNDPGQIIRAYGTAEEISSAVRFISPPDYASGYNESVNNLIINTLTQCGANEAALGDLDATNTSAIIELREAAAKYLVPLKNRYYRFIEDISLIWAEFFFSLYGKRNLKITDENGIWYFPFDAARYKSLVLSVSVTAGDAVSRGERETVSALGSLYEKGAITAVQYLERLPDGIIPNSEQLIKEINAKREEAANERI